VVGQQPEEVDQVLAVVADLDAGVQSRPGSVLDIDESFGLLVAGGVGPLLELDDDERVLAGLRVDAGQHGVDAPAGQRQLVLDQYFNLVQVGVGEVLGQDGQTVAARSSWRYDTGG